MQGLGPLTRDFTQKSLRQWKRDQRHARSFTVVRHPLLRAHAACFEQVLPGHLPEFRTAFARTLKVDLPPPPKAGRLSVADRQAVFAAFLRFARLNLSGQTAVRVPPPVATQSALIQGFTQFQAPDLTLREDRLDQGLAFLASEIGTACPLLPPDDGAEAAALAAILTPEIEEAAREAYGRDYQGFGFSPGWSTT